jgi:ribose-phosphate pyrophosphokinase
MGGNINKGARAMPLTMFTGSANVPLAAAVAEQLEMPLGSRRLQRFPDGELHVEIEESVRGHDVYLIQSTTSPVDAHLLELWFLADACRRAGASHLTAVVPYFGYARQDRRASGREAVGARLIADLFAASGLQRLVAVDLHSAPLEGFFGLPVEHLSAVPLLADAVRPMIPANAVVVAPDLGAVKLAERYSYSLHLPMAIVDKKRLTGEEVRARRVVGRVEGCPVLVVDDMISTGGTVQAAIQALLAAGCAPEVTVAASHALFVGPVVERLRELPIRRLLATDSVAASAQLPFPVHGVSLAPLLAEAIRRLHGQQSLGDLILHA